MDIEKSYISVFKGPKQFLTQGVSTRPAIIYQLQMLIFKIFQTKLVSSTLRTVAVKVVYYLF